MTGNESRRRKVSAATVAGTLLAIVAFTAVNALSNGAFEYYDGNTTNEAGRAGPDWDQVYAGTSGFGATSVTPDPDYRNEATIFTMGSKDINEISTGWFWRVVGQVPDKTDLLHALSAYDAANDQLYFAADRYATNGDTKVGFWFLQDDVAAVEGGTFSGDHTDGDIMIESNFTQGGKIDTIKVYTWHDGGLVPNGVAGGDCGDAGAASYDVCAINNPDQTTASWPYAGKFAPNYKPGAFIEGALDLTALFDGNVPCFGSFLAETRASGSSITSELKDFVLADFDTCADITIQKVRSGGTAADTFDFTTGGGLSPASFELTGATSVGAVGAGNRQVFTNVEAGTYTVTEGPLTGDWMLTNIVCTGATTAVTDGTNRRVTITAAAGEEIVCTFYNALPGGPMTRTQGFWQTHPNLATEYWGASRSIGACRSGGNAVTTSTSALQDKLMGGFWAGISTRTNGQKRTALDQARMTLLQQLLAAKLNNYAFGSEPTGSVSIAQAEAAYCGSNIGTIKSAASAMGAFNEGGDYGSWSPGESADPAEAQRRANLATWNTLP